MNKNELKALVNGLIALCQNENILPTTTSALADELQSIAANEIYIPIQELVYFIEEG